MKQQHKKNCSIRSLKKKAWTEFSKYIRLKNADRDGYVHCYTCGKRMFWKEAQAGHGLSGRGNSILFDEEIVKPQCASCNIFKGGNYDSFHSRLIEENGIEWFNRKLKQKHETKQFTAKELEDMIKYYREEIKKIEKSY